MQSLLFQSLAQTLPPSPLHRPTGMLTVCGVLWQYDVSSGAKSNPHACNVVTLCAPLFGLQGGGVYVEYDGVANFESCNIHDNTATYVCLHL